MIRWHQFNCSYWSYSDNQAFFTLRWWCSISKQHLPLK
jgi:hypothetical protein